MVNDLWNFIRNIRGYTAQIAVRGANDIEAGYSLPGPVNDWINGYATGGVTYLDFGDAGGCPWNYYNQTSNAAGCSNGWNQDNFYNDSWGATPAWPFTEIYNSPAGDSNPNYAVNAYQWQRIFLYAVLHYGQANLPSPVGAMAQSQACADVGNPCTGTNNTPNEAWGQLWDALTSDSRTAPNTNWFKFASSVSWQTQ